jgi:hypothetical protein
VKQILVLMIAVVTLTWAAVAEPDQKQDTATRSVSGVVIDGSENIIEGAVVQLKDTKTLNVRSFITLKDGGYRFHGLSRDVDYELEAKHQGASSGTRTLSSFDNRSQAVINLKLKK